MDSVLQKNYRKNQMNGTIYMNTCLPVSPERLNELEAGDGELFITCIYKRCTPEEIMRVALELGDVYMLRFKVDYLGLSRGYAYLQFIEERHYMLALRTLKKRFKKAKLTNICVRKSNNHKTLVLRHVDRLGPLEVYDKLRLIGQYVKLSIFEVRCQSFIYIVMYRNNEQAAVAHQSLRNKLMIFGENASVEWLSKGKAKSSLEEDPRCCLQLSRSNNFEQLRRLVEDKAPCTCFRI